jgi:hypothetical protein
MPASPIPRTTRFEWHRAARLTTHSMTGDRARASDQAPWLCARSTCSAAVNSSCIVSISTSVDYSALLDRFETLHEA